MTVAALVAAYNEAATIERVVAGLRPYVSGVLVVDDGSTDRTPEIVKSFKDDRLRYIRKPNGGVASALNMGIAAMTSDYFCWLSHDDLFTRHKIRRQVRAYWQFRRSSDAMGDQHRTTGPAEAVAAGADYVVVGRPISQAADPRAEAELIIDEIAEALLHRRRI